MAFRFDTSDLIVKETPEGYLAGESVFTRTGVFKYLNNDGTIRLELRHPRYVLDADSLNSLIQIPVTLNHPANFVTPGNAKELSVGMTGEAISTRGTSPTLVAGRYKITDEGAIAAVKAGKQQLSLGYFADVVEENGEYEGEKYTHIQTNIRYNHLAIVDKARAGDVASINLDSDDVKLEDVGIMHADETFKEVEMKKINLDGIEYDAAPEVIKKLEATQKKLDSNSAEIEKLKVALSEAQGKLDASEAQAKELKSKVDAAEIKELQGYIKEVFGFETKADSAIELKKQAILHIHKDAKFDGKDEVYIAARFDAAVDFIKSQPNKEVGIPFALGKKDSEPETDFTTDSYEKRHNDALEAK